MGSRSTIRPGTRVRIVSVSEEEGDKTLIGCMGYVQPEPFKPDGYRVRAGMITDWPPHHCGRRVNILDCHQVVEVVPVRPKYDIEFVRVMIFRSLGVLNLVPSAEIQKEEDIHANTDTRLRMITVKAGYVDFDLCETVIETVGAEPQFGYYVHISRLAGSGSFDNPPDTAEWESEPVTDPVKAIQEGIIACAKEAMDLRCYTEIEYTDWWEMEKP